MEKCEMAFVCGKTWNDLAPTTIARARYCDDCGRNVFLVESDDELQLARSLGRCVAVKRSRDMHLTVGEPAPRWPVEPGARVLLTLEAQVDPQRIDELKRNFPAVFAGDSEGVLSGKGVDLGEHQAAEVEALLEEFARHAPEFVVRLASSAST